MARTSVYRRQHSEMLEVIDTIPLDPSQLAADATAARSGLTTLAVKVSAHLRMEDDALYPELAKAPDPDVRQLAGRFQSEMGGLAGAFKEFLDRWPSEPAIRAEPAVFAESATPVVAALRDRIAREEAELYPRADDV